MIFHSIVMKYMNDDATIDSNILIYAFGKQDNSKSRIMDKYQYSFWDSMMLASALENKCTEIYSEDMQHNQTIEDKLRIINPFL
jgi:predicted nucleic acid-binding protein